MIYFIGAGPGSVDLITVRGAEILGRSDMIIYAGSLVNPELVKKYACANCELYDSAGMTLTEESLKSGRIRKYIDITADSAGGKTASIFDALTLTNKDGYIFVFIVSDSKTSEQLASDLKSDPNVVSASPNRQLHMN